jgi:hypothetical protein
MTLVVDTGLCPPSRGGELLLGTDKDETEEWLPSGAGSFCAWGTDVENEVKPLLSGNRCVAVYNVCAEDFNKEGLRKRKLDSIVDALRSLVKEKANDSSENSTKTHIGFVLEKISSRFSRKNTISDNPLGSSVATLLKTVQRGFGVAKEDLQVLRSVSLTGEGFRGVHGDYIEEVPTSNTKEEQSEPDDREDGKVSGGNSCNELVDEVSDEKRTTKTEIFEGSVVTVLAVDPQAKSPLQHYVVPAQCYNSTWMLNADPDSTCYFGYDPTTNNGTDLYVSCSIYLRVPRKYFPELNVPRKRGRCTEGGGEDQKARQPDHRSRATRTSRGRHMRLELASKETNGVNNKKLLQ